MSDNIQFAGGVDVRRASSQAPRLVNNRGGRTLVGRNTHFFFDTALYNLAASVTTMMTIVNAIIDFVETIEARFAKSGCNYPIERRILAS